MVFVLQWTINTLVVAEYNNDDDDNCDDDGDGDNNDYDIILSDMLMS